jgi:glucose-6-phosphate isomerase
MKIAGIDCALGAYEDAIRTRLVRLTREQAAARLARRDPGLWPGDAQAHEAIRHRLGWLEVPAAMRARVAELEEFTQSITDAGFTHALLLGMGGSSLAPETMMLTYGTRPGRLELAILDNTSPHAVRWELQRHDPRTTLVIVSSKSGGTIEVTSFERAAFEWMEKERGAEAGSAFVAITDPGTQLEHLARTRNYRKTFLNPPDIGGRYSALSYFGLVPAALIGVDLSALLDRAVAELDTARLETDAAANPGVALGAALGELGREGRDKLTLVLGESLEALGAWIEQLVAESTGKQGRGILPVDEEPLADPSVYANDRVFVAVSVGELPPPTRNALSALEAAGHPVVRWNRSSCLDLGAEFARWEVATAIAAHGIDVNPFDEPNVSEAKQSTQQVLARYLERGHFDECPPLASFGGLTACAPDAIAERLRPFVKLGGDPTSWARALPALLEPGDYFAVLAYMTRTPERHELLQRVRLAIRDRHRVATTLGYGPRFLHSTGQFHKGGPDTGVFLQICAEKDEYPIPGERYGFKALHRAQATGDYQVLERRGRRVLRIDLGVRDHGAALTALADAIAGIPEDA